MGTRYGPAGLVIIPLHAALRIGTQLSVPCLVQTFASPEKDSYRTTAALKMNNPALFTFPLLLETRETRGVSPPCGSVFLSMSYDREHRGWRIHEVQV